MSFIFTSCFALAGIFPLTERNFSSEMLNVSLPLFTSIFTRRTVLTNNYSLYNNNNNSKNLRGHLKMHRERLSNLVCVPFKRAILGTGRYGRGLGGQERWGDGPAASGEGRCSKQRLPSGGTKPPKRRQEGTPVPGFSGPEFPVGSIDEEEDTPCGTCSRE